MEIKFHIWDNGDPTVGDYGNAAEVTMTIHEDNIKWAKEQLVEAFRGIWDNGRVYIMTDEEMKSED